MSVPDGHVAEHIPEPFCQICLRTPQTNLPPSYCPTCARNLLYEPRFRHVRTLLEKEQLGRKIEGILAAGRTDRTGNEDRDQLSAGKAHNSAAAKEAHGLRRGSEEQLGDETEEDVERKKAVRRIRHDQLKDELTRTQERVGEIANSCATLRSEMDQLRASMDRRRAAMARKKEHTTAAVRELARVEEETVRTLRKETARFVSKAESLHARTATSRVFLCREVASLFGLDVKRRRKGTSERDVYLIGSVPIVDLRDLNNAPFDQISVSATRVAHLLLLTSHYLGLRLPSEITLPLADHPYINISPPFSSYREPTAPAIHTASTAGRNTFHSPSTSIHSGPASSSATKQRAIHLDRPIPTLVTEDPIAYSLFVDALTLLAWDLAWLAKTQGLDVGARHWEDVCAIGRNLWLLFAAPLAAAPLAAAPALQRLMSPCAPPSSPIPPTATDGGANTGGGGRGGRLLRSPSSPGNAAAAGPSSPSAATGRSTNPPSSPALPTQPLQPGRFSHGTAHAFLAAAGPAGGAEHMRGWRFSNPVRIIERIKGALANERMGAEWEVLEEEEWREEGEGPSGDRGGGGGGGDGNGDAVAKPEDQQGGESGDVVERRNGAKGKEKVVIERGGGGGAADEAGINGHDGSAGPDTGSETERKRKEKLKERERKGWMKVRSPEGTES